MPGTSDVGSVVAANGIGSIVTAVVSVVAIRRYDPWSSIEYWLSTVPGTDPRADSATWSPSRANLRISVVTADDVEVDEEVRIASGHCGLKRSRCSGVAYTVAVPEATTPTAAAGPAAGIAASNDVIVKSDCSPGDSGL